MDYVFPNKNEQQFIHMAEHLGLHELTLVYPYQGAKEAREHILPTGTLKLTLGFLCKAVDLGKQLPPGAVRITQADQNLRTMLEQHEHVHFYGAEKIFPKDGFHHRYSGLDPVLCALMQQHHHSYLLNLSHIIEAKEQHRALILGRMKQNLLLCRRFRVDYSVVTFAQTPYGMRSPHDIASFSTFLHKR